MVPLGRHEAACRQINDDLSNCFVQILDPVPPQSTAYSLAAPKILPHHTAAITTTVQRFSAPPCSDTPAHECAGIRAVHGVAKAAIPSPVPHSSCCSTNHGELSPFA